MANLNEVRLIGRLTRDPELRSTSSGQPVASFGLATSKKFRSQNGTEREDTVFVDITCWGKLAEIVSQYMRKGSQIYLGGRLKLDNWEDRQTGQKRSKLSVVAENVQFLDKKEQPGPAPDPGWTRAPQPPAPMQAWNGTQQAEADFGDPPF